MRVNYFHRNEFSLAKEPHVDPRCTGEYKQEAAARAYINGSM